MKKCNKLHSNKFYLTKNLTEKLKMNQSRTPWNAASHPKGVRAPLVGNPCFIKTTLYITGHKKKSYLIFLKS